MYTYKFVNIKHSAWTGKPQVKIEEVIEEQAAKGWRFVQILQDHAAMWYKGRIYSKIVFEREVGADFYEYGAERPIENEFV